MSNSCAVIIPIYRPELTAVDAFSLDFSLRTLNGRPVYFAAPEGMDVSYYVGRCPSATFVRFPAHLFASIQGYNHLLLSSEFYELFLPNEFVLILQTDAILLRDELDHWTSLPFDYVGAPWPRGNELLVQIPPFEGAFARPVKALVGNGGLSLRRISGCLSLLKEFPVALQIFLQTGSSEDLFFSFMGLLSKSFVLPNEITASLFSTEVQPEAYYQINGNVLPMGTHAWAKYSPEFWRAHLDVPTSVLP